MLADKGERLRRIMLRDNITEEEGKKRISSQKNDEFYIENSDYIVYNKGNKEDLIFEVEKVIDDIRSRN